MAWKRRQKNRWQKPPKPDPVEALVQLTPQNLRQRLRVIDQFIAEAEPAIAAWELELGNLLNVARSAYRELHDRWQAVGSDILEHSNKIREDIKLFCERAYRRWQANTPFFDRLFVADGRPQLASNLQSWLIGTNFPSEMSLMIHFRFKWDDVLKTPISSGEDLLDCTPRELLAVRDELQPTLKKRRDIIADAFHKITDSVESSEAVGMGSLLKGWKDWKLSMAVCVGDVPGDQVGKPIPSSEWQGGSIFDWKCFQPHLPDLVYSPTRKLHGRRLYDGAIAKAQRERTLIVSALERIAQEARALREKHGFDDKMVAAAAAFFRQTRDLADQLRNEMLEDLRKQSQCPYCTGPLGDTPHLDHIHPCSHGGFSKRDNLVFVCSTCNLKKGDRTLLEFAERTGFDFGQLVQRLRGLGKRV